MERLQRGFGYMLLCCMCFIIVPLTTGIGMAAIWASLALHSDREAECDTPIRAYVYGFIALIFWNTWCQQSFLSECLGYDPRENPERPLRVKIYQAIYFVVQIVWNIIGLVWIFDAKTCQETAPDIYSSAKILALLQITFYALMIFVISTVYFLIWQTRSGWAGLDSANGCPPQFVESLEVVPYTRDNFDDVRYPCDCCVCMDEFGADTARIIVKTPCDHIFHKDCLEGWLKSNKSCPVCRTDLVEAIEKEQGDAPDPPGVAESAAVANDEGESVPLAEAV